NVASVERAAPRVAFDGASLDGWTMSGLWHASRRHADSDGTSLWFGDEGSGTYDTGNATRGDLVSPVIDLAGIDHPVLAWTERLDVEGDVHFDRATVTVVDV